MVPNIEQFGACEEAYHVTDLISSSFAWTLVYCIPSSNNGVNGGSELNGCAPVNLSRRGSRGTWLSGVAWSTPRISVAGFEEGGRGISGWSVAGMSPIVIRPGLRESWLLSMSVFCSVTVVMIKAIAGIQYSSSRGDHYIRFKNSDVYNHSR